MAKAGLVIENPVAGDRVVFRRTAADSNGEVLEFDLFADPGAQGPPEHIHPSQEESFTVISGTVRALIRGREHAFTAGEEFVVAAGTPHTWWNDGEEEAQVRVEVRPASRLEDFLKTMYGLAKDGKTNRKGVPNPLQLAVVARQYFDVIHVARPPLVVQRVVFGVLGPLGRLLGYRADYPYPYGDAGAETHQVSKTSASAQGSQRSHGA